MSSEPSSPSSLQPPALAHALAPGTQLRDYSIGNVIGTGGFSIVYKALDNSLEREVAIKEYFPTSLALRAPDGSVQPHSRDSATFSKGIESFLNEGKLLAAFDHPALVRVYRCWEERGTAYLAMRLYTGETLRDAVKAGTWRTDAVSLVALLQPICDALDVLHAAKCYHRDVAPDNIMLVDAGARLMPVLLDFGAARKAIESTQVFTAILKPGYAPIEQYGDGDLKQGPWTDIYALAGVVYFTLLGNAPPTAINRMLRDAMPRPRDAFVGRLPERWLDAIEHALAVMPEARPQTISEFVALFDWDAVAESPPARAPIITAVPPVESTAALIDAEQTVVTPLPPPPLQATPSTPVPRKSNAPRTALRLGAALVLVAAALLTWRMTAAPSVPPDAKPATVAVPDAKPTVNSTPSNDTLSEKKTSKPVSPVATPEPTMTAPPRKPAIKPSRPIAATDGDAEVKAAKVPQKSSARERPARCEPLIERFQLGETFSAADQTFFQESCK